LQASNSTIAKTKQLIWRAQYFNGLYETNLQLKRDWKLQFLSFQDSTSSPVPFCTSPSWFETPHGSKIILRLLRLFLFCLLVVRWPNYESHGNQSMGQNADKLHHALGNFFTLMIIWVRPLWLLLITKAWAMCKSWSKGKVETCEGTRWKEVSMKFW
jgi:hypothetical protein